MLPLLLACVTSDYSLTAADDPAFAPTDDLGGSSAIAAWERIEEVDEVGEVEREELFITGPAPTAVADYLFVIDESISMRNIMENFQRGMRSMSRPGVFPRSARLAVMNTTPGDPDDLSYPHPATSPIPGERSAPGFLRLVDEEGMAGFRRQTVPKFEKRYDLTGCSAWFTPRQRNDQGQLCLRAHSQIPLTQVGAEAGLVALSQWLEKNAGQARFRPGAAVNIVFISDTHDPGIRSEDLLALQPTVDDLRALIDEDDVIASLRLHAIAPRSRCSERWEEPSYFLAAGETRGVGANSCTLDDYAKVIRKIAQTGALTQEPVFPLGYRADEILSVTVDDEPVGFTVAADGAVVVLPEELAADEGILRVRYRASE